MKLTIINTITEYDATTFYKQVDELTEMFGTKIVLVPHFINLETLDIVKENKPVIIARSEIKIPTFIQEYLVECFSDHKLLFTHKGFNITTFEY